MRPITNLFVALALFWIQPARAQEGHLGHDHEKWHQSFYQTLVRPDTKTSCCNLTDCRPTSGRQVDDHYEVMHARWDGARSLWVTETTGLLGIMPVGWVRLPRSEPFDRKYTRVPLS